jgi:Cu/Ag efflux protein CusF
MQLGKSLVLAIAVLGTSYAGAQSVDRAVHHVAQAGSPASSSSDMFDGEVRKVDRDAGKITLKHGEMKSLEMPPMTMVFQVKDKAMLDKVKAGDKVRFSAVKAGGALTVTAIEVAK